MTKYIYLVLVLVLGGFAVCLMNNFFLIKQIEQKNAELEGYVQILSKSMEMHVNSSQKKRTELYNQLKALYVKFGYSFSDLDQSSLDQGSFSESSGGLNPLSFAYYESQEWKSRVTDFVAKSPSQLDVNIITHAGKDSEETLYSINGKGVFRIDGIFHETMDNYDFGNELHNVIVVTTPGLAGTKADTITIRGDSGTDSVILDGCLIWKKKSENNSFYLWEATDSSGVNKEVKIASGLYTQPEGYCDGDYVDMQRENLASKAWGSGFTGIGIRFSKSSGDVLLIKDVLPGSPAEKAGLYSGDTILKINGKLVAGMHFKQAANAIRGRPGSSVTLVIKPSGSVNTEKEVSVTREALYVEGGN